MYNVGYIISGLNYVYLVFEVGLDKLKEIVEGMKVMGVVGFNVFMFNKIDVI